MSYDALQLFRFSSPSPTRRTKVIRSPASIYDLIFFTGNMSQKHVPPVTLVSCLLISVPRPWPL